jgi:hypothetical protein
VVAAADGSTASYTVSVAVASISAKAITAFSLNGTPGVIYGPNIIVTVPFGTAVNALAASFTTTGESLVVGGTSQVSGTTVNDFTGPVTYVVTAADGSTASYSVLVNVAANTAKAMTGFSLAGTTGLINGQGISVTVPFGTAVNALAASFTTTGESVVVDGTSQVSGTTVDDFTTPVTYVVTAADSTTASYPVSVNVAANTAKAITGFSLASVAPAVNCQTLSNGLIACSSSISAPPLAPVAGAIDGNNILITLPVGGTYPANLAATFETTGESVTVNSVTQISGSTVNGFFAGPVTYVVTAADGSTASYTVKVVASDPLCFFTVVPGGSATTTTCS